MIAELIMISLMVICVVVYSILFYYHQLIEPSPEDWPDAHTITIVESDTANIIYQRTLFFFDKKHAREYAFAHFKSFYEDKNYEVDIEYD